MNKEEKEYYLENAREFYSKFPQASVQLCLKIDENGRLLTQATYTDIYEDGEPVGLEEFRKLLRGFFSG